jgi:hypothetical protein
VSREESLKKDKSDILPKIRRGPESNGHRLREHTAVQASNGVQMRTSRYQAVLIPLQTAFWRETFFAVGIENSTAILGGVPQDVGIPNGAYIKEQREFEYKNKTKKVVRLLNGLSPNRTGVICINTLRDGASMECRRGPPAAKPYPPFSKPDFMQDFYHKFLATHNELSNQSEH